MTKHTNEIIKDYTLNGFRCIIKKVGYEHDEETLKLPYMRNNHWLCGYVEIPEEHKYHNVEYMDIEEYIHVHGGLTYSGNLVDDKYFLGFDCNHYEDDINIQNQEYVENQLKSLVEQLIKNNENSTN